MKPTTIAIIILGVSGCASGGVETSSTENVTFEEFEANTYREPWEGGHYIVDGDTPIPDAKQLQEFWGELQQGALIVNRVGGSDDKWNNTQKLNLTYCVSNNFGNRKQLVLDAMVAATSNGWEARANVDFKYLSQYDSNCTNTNQNVVFNIRQVSGQPYLARAFFPSSSRPSREVLIDTSSFGDVGWPLGNILGHELGHTLGFRHEHTRPEAGTCFENNNWRALTSYDSASIMHYPQCNGSSDDLSFTSKDAQGAESLYGPPGDEPPPPPGYPKDATYSGSLARYETDNYGPFSVVPGTTFTAAMTGSGDPDLYVRWGSPPTTTSYNCRPYTASASERCSMTVPSGTSQAYVMIRGYTAASYSVDVDWVSPTP
jgi:serine protease